VFVTGEPGIGKTALVEAFLAQVGEGEAVRVGRGQCVEHYGAGEAYLPVLEALGRLGREPGDRKLVDVLMRYAPTWLAQLPAFLTDRDLEAVQRRAQGATRDRMLRELVEALDAFGDEWPLILVLEDLHWSDSATVDLLAMLARRREASRLLVLGTYRPADVAAGDAQHLLSVKRELELHGHCEELSLEFLDAAAVAEYLARRFPPGPCPPELALALHRNTEGNPLFLVNAVEYLIARGQMRDAGGRWELSVPVESIAAAVPETLWQMVERQIERLTPDERAVLAVASVAGAEFSAAVVTADEIDGQEGERLCAALARRGQFVRAAGVAEWPDGTAAGRYAFIHALYQQVLYASVSVGRRVGLHLRIGERLERGHGQRAGEIAGELAAHFERGRDVERAMRYRRQAGDNALRHHGYREAADHARRALALLAALPDAPAHRQDELALQVMLGAALAPTQGFAGPEVARVHARARELCADAGDDARLLPVLLALGRFHNIRGEVELARAVGRRLLAVADATRDRAVRLAAHNALGIMAFYGGQLDAALAHLDEGSRLYDPGQHGPGGSAVLRAGQDPGVSCAVYAAWTLQLLGYPARAAARMREALSLGRSLAHPFSLTYACHFAAGFHQCRGERDAVQALEDEAVALSTEHGFRLFLIAGAIHRGWVLSEQARADEGIARIREGLAAWRAIGAELRRPAFAALLAEACGKAGRPDEGLAAVSEGLLSGARTGQHYWDAELHRLRGALTLAAAPGDGAGIAGSHDERSSEPHARSGAAERDAEAAFHQAVAVARGQGAKWLELRAVTGLCRLWAGQGRTSQARAWLAEVHGWFTEGFDTADLREARSLLADLERLEGRPPGPSAERREPTTRRGA
jgi:predicted ATPase